MRQTYCEACGKTVEIEGRRCLAGHLIEPPRQVPTLRRPRVDPETDYRSTLLEMMGLSNVEERPVPPPASPPPLLAAPGRTVQRRVRAIPTQAIPPRSGNGDMPPGMVERMWTEDRETEGSLGDDWVPGLMPTDDRRGPQWRRWWPILLLVLLVVGVLLVVQTFRNAPQRTADTVAARYLEAAQNLQTSADGLDTSIVTLTDPAAAALDLTDATVALNTFLADTDEASLRADPALPAPPPFGSANPIEALAPTRQRLLFATDLAGSIGDRLGAVYTYRLLLDDAFLLPDLPDSALPEEVPDLRVSLAATVADTRRAVTDLPDEDLLATHRQQVLLAANRLEAWQAEYLDALRRQDPAGSAALKAEITALIGSLRTSLAEPLGVMRSTIQADMASLQSVLTRVTTDLTARD